MLLYLFTIVLICFVEPSFLRQLRNLGGCQSGCEMNCGFSNTLIWDDVQPFCRETIDEFDGGKYYPSFFFQLDVVPTTGRPQIVETVGLAPCNNNGLNSGTEFSWFFQVPAKLKRKWNLNNRSYKTFQITPYSTNPDMPEFTPYQIKMNCAYDTTGSLPPYCPNGCYGPFAQCKSGTCSCGGVYQLASNGYKCSYPSTAPAPVPRQNCVLGAERQTTVCSNPCGNGVKTIEQPVVQPATGGGTDCPGDYCDRPPPALEDRNCRYKRVACNGISEGLGSGCLTPTPVPKGGPAPSPSSEGCDGCRCRGGVGGTCDNGARECRSGFCLNPLPQDASAGCLNCKCRTVAPLCDGDYQCQNLKCVDQSGCAGCKCHTGSVCDAGLTCSSAQKVCVFSTPTQPPTPNGVRACPEGSERCACFSDNTCQFQFLQCEAGRCVAQFSQQQGPAAAPMTIKPKGEVSASGDDGSIGIIIAAVAGAVCFIASLIGVAVVVVCVVNKSGDGGVTVQSEVYDPSSRAQPTSYLRPEDASAPYPSQSESAAYPSQTESAAYPSQTGSSTGGAYPSMTGTAGAYPSTAGDEYPGEYAGQYGTGSYPTGMSEYNRPYAEGGENAGGEFICGACGKGYPTAADLKHHQDKRH